MNSGRVGQNTYIKIDEETRCLKCRPRLSLNTPRIWNQHQPDCLSIGAIIKTARLGAALVSQGDTALSGIAASTSTKPRFKTGGDMTDKDAKKALLRNWKAQEAEKAINQFPLDDAQLDRFFSELDNLMSEVSCSHDQSHAHSVIANMRLSPEQSRTLLAWCKVNGGYCDCEILGNTYDHWDQYRGRA